MLLLAGSLMFSQEKPVFSATGPDAAEYGAAENFTWGSPANAFEKKYMIGTFSHFDKLYPTHTVSPAAKPWAFQRPATAPEIEYVHAGSHYELKDYLAHLPVTGLLIAKDDRILFEGYQYARTDRDRFTSQSMAKTIVSMLAGVALSEGKLGATSDTAAKYLPELKGSDYGAATLRNLLHMSSGVTCRMPELTLGTAGLLELARDCKRDVPAGTRFRYSGADSQVLGLAVARAVRMPLSTYLQEKIWEKIGTESSASWTIGGWGEDLAYCCFNATLRDYARFGRLLAHDGAWNGTQLIPRQWLLDATTVKDSDAQLEPGKPAPFFGYGYQLWVLPGGRRMFALLGANGQRIFVDPETKLILVQTAVMEKEIDRAKDAETIGLFLSLVHHYGAE